MKPMQLDQRQRMRLRTRMRPHQELTRTRMMMTTTTTMTRTMMWMVTGTTIMPWSMSLDCLLGCRRKNTRTMVSLVMLKWRIPATSNFWKANSHL
jgi:hypothetical protein